MGRLLRRGPRSALMKDLHPFHSLPLPPMVRPTDLPNLDEDRPDCDRLDF